MRNILFDDKTYMINKNYMQVYIWWCGQEFQREISPQVIWGEGKIRISIIDIILYPFQLHQTPQAWD